MDKHLDKMVFFSISYFQFTVSNKTKPSLLASGHEKYFEFDHLLSHK